jgi:hypothetical protein
MTRRRNMAFFITALIFSSCLEGTSYVTPDKSDKVAKYIMDAPPERIEKRFNVLLEDKIVFLGYETDKAIVAPGEKVKITWYWQCKQAPGPGWRLFTHVFDGKGKTRINKDGTGPVRKNFQPEHWKPGLVVRDPQEIEVPKNWNSDVIEFRTGLWKGKSRMAVKGEATDSSSRIIGPRIKVQTKAARPVMVNIPRAETAPVIDGKFDDEKVWESAAKLSSFKQTMTGKASNCVTSVKLLWDDTSLYVAMHSEDDFLVSKFEKHDDELWKEDAFEIFLDPLGDEKDYYELQVSPAGVVFDSYLPNQRQNNNDWTSNMTVKVSLEGKLNDPSDEDKGWSAELAIPFASLKQGDSAPPKVDDKWRGNFFRVDLQKTKPEYCAWSPPLRGDFHALDRFGVLVFRGADFDTKPKKKDVKDGSKGAAAKTPAEAENLAPDMAITRDKKTEKQK